MAHLFLSWWEVLLTRLLMRSRRISGIAIREYGTDIHWILYQRDDPFLARPFEPFEPDLEPPSMLLERLYHAPDASK